MSARFDPDTVNVVGLEKLLKALKAKPPVARVGVLAAENARSGSAGNATIGAVHEYGAPGRGIPQRSFLRVPISEHLQEQMESGELVGEAETKEVLKQGSVVPWLNKVAGIALQVVKTAFQTGGYGKWAPWKDPNYENNTGMLLVDSHQLRDSITKDVKE